MPDCGDCWHIIDKSVLTAKAFLQRPLETIRLIAFVVAVQVIPAHLINHNPDYQLRTWQKRRLFLCLTHESTKEQEPKKQYSY